MEEIKKENAWQVRFAGNLIQIETNDKGHEKASRSPGVRLLLFNSDGKILLTKEYRNEQERFDFRLPGGKVFDDLKSWLEAKDDKPGMEKAALTAARLEAKQEAGVTEIKDLQVFHTSKDGATMEWDLIYLKGEVVQTGEQELDGDEAIHGIETGYYTKEQVLKMLLEKQISEDRTVGVLCRELLKDLNLTPIS